MGGGATTFGYKGTEFCGTILLMVLKKWSQQGNETQIVVCHVTFLRMKEWWIWEKNTFYGPQTPQNSLWVKSLGDRIWWERERERGKVMEKKKEIKIWHLRHLLAVNATAILYAALHRLSRLSLVVKVSYLLRHEIGARHTFSK